jgi:hypothetical protein
VTAREWAIAATTVLAAVSIAVAIARRNDPLPPDLDPAGPTGRLEAGWLLVAIAGFYSLFIVVGGNSPPAADGRPAAGSTLSGIVVFVVFIAVFASIWALGWRAHRRTGRRLLNYQLAAFRMAVVPWSWTDRRRFWVSRGSCSWPRLVPS